MRRVLGTIPICSENPEVHNLRLAEIWPCRAVNKEEAAGVSEHEDQFRLPQ